MTRKSCVITGNGHKHGMGGQGDEGPGEADDLEDDSFFVGFSATFPLSFVLDEHVDSWLFLFQSCICVFYSSAPSTTKS